MIAGIALKAGKVVGSAVLSVVISVVVVNGVDRIKNAYLKHKASKTPTKVFEWEGNWVDIKNAAVSQ